MDGFSWLKKSAAYPTCGLTDDGASLTASHRLTAVQKNAKLDFILGQITNYATSISHTSIVKKSTSLNDIWIKIHEHYGFQTNGSRFLDLSHIQLAAGQCPDLYKHHLSFFDDNVLTIESGSCHHRAVAHIGEEVSPSLENFIAFCG